jgi:hypothetical protein
MLVRPEHFRRHISTVHSNERCHSCKVCSKTFSKGDNLRQHYWTHLEREGRAGHSKRMSFADLKEVLGRREGPLLKRLKLRLDLQTAKNMEKRSNAASCTSLHIHGSAPVVAPYAPLLPGSDQDWRLLERFVSLSWGRLGVAVCAGKTHFRSTERVDPSTPHRCLG